jgi:hypothetical protein
VAASEQNPKYQGVAKKVDLPLKIDLATGLPSGHEKDLGTGQERGQGSDLETDRGTGNVAEAENGIIVGIDIGLSLSQKTKRKQSAAANADENDVPVEKRRLELTSRTNCMPVERMMLTGHGVPHHQITSGLVIEAIAEKKTNPVTVTGKGIESETISLHRTNIAPTAQKETIGQEAEIGIETEAGNGIETRTGTVNVAAIVIMTIVATTLAAGHQKSPKRRSLTASRFLLLPSKTLLLHGNNRSSQTRPLDLRFEEPLLAGNRSLLKCQTFPQVHVAIENERVI